MNMYTESELDKFRRSINTNLAIGSLADTELPVVDNNGRHPVVAALGGERLAVLLRRIENVGGYANVFVDAGDSVCMLAFVDSSGALDVESAEDLASDGQRPGSDATVGMFIEYLSLKPNGVRLPARLVEDRPFILAPREVHFA
ncbi:hypothetical protein [Microbacterium sp. 22296]|uniref:hypothetical protein n=1 Tax=Microbacterium sp. 22296 TaxID=3453903 RepID=UPI003F8283FA